MKNKISQLTVRLFSKGIPENFENVVMFHGKHGFGIGFNKLGKEILNDITDTLYSDKNLSRSFTKKKLLDLFLDFFFEIFDKGILPSEPKNEVNTFITFLNTIRNSKVIVIIPIAGLNIKKKMLLPNYQLLSISNFKKEYKTKLSKQLMDEFTGKINGSIAITEDYGDNFSLIEKHKILLDEELNIIRFYIPMFWHPDYDIKIQVCNYRIMNGIICLAINGTKYKNNARIGSNRFFEIDSKRDPRDKNNIRTIINKYGYNDLVTIYKMNSQLSGMIKTVLSWTGLYTQYHPLNNRLLYIIFALEVLFTNENNNYSSITAAVGEKCSYLLGKDEKHRIDIFNFVKDLYTNRSKIVHGSSVIVGNDIILEEAYQLLFASLNMLIKIIKKNKLNSKKDISEYFIKRKFQ